MSRMVIYLITNILDGKYYVGRDKNVNSRYNRWKQHCYEARRGCKFHLHSALREEGIDNFRFEIITEAKSFEELKNLEKLWIISLRAYDPLYGYNMTVGGEGAGYSDLSVEVRKEIGKRIADANRGRKQSPEERKMRSEIRKGSHPSAEARAKNGGSHRGTKHNYTKRRKPFSEEHNKNISLSQSNRTCI
jgi:group I intron endonuclease